MNFLLWALLLSGLGLLGLSYWIADLVLYARRQPLTHTPGDYGLPYEDVSFSSHLGLYLQGWWIATPMAEKAVILLHPFLGNRQGVEPIQRGILQPWPPSVDLLRVAQAFHAEGYAVLLFDFRSHGQSERNLCAGGLTEDQDVVGAVDYTFCRLATERPGIRPLVGVVGFGAGASAALTAVGREKGSADAIRFFSGDSEGGSGFIEYQPPNVKRLRFLIAVEPLSMRRYLRGSLHPSLAPLSPLLLPLISGWCSRRGGYPLSTGYLPRFVSALHLPVLYVGVCTQREGADCELQCLYSSTPGPTEIYWLDVHQPESERYADLCTRPDPLLSFAAHHLTVPT